MRFSKGATKSLKDERAICRHQIADQKITIDLLDKTYKFCMSNRSIKEKSIDIEIIKSLKIVAEKGLEFINSKSRNIPKDSKD